MRKVSRDEFKDAMRRAEIEKRIREADKKANRIEQEDKDMNTEEVEKEMGDIIGDSAAAYFAHDSEADIDMEPEMPKRKPGRPKKEAAETKKPGRKPKEKVEVAAAPKKRGRKPKTDKPQETAVQMASKTMDEAIDKAAKQEESLRFLIGVTRGRMSEIIHNAEAHIKTADKLIDLAEAYEAHIKTVEEMLK